jgi:hypothetical protein
VASRKKCSREDEEEEERRREAGGRGVYSARKRTATSST